MVGEKIREVRQAQGWSLVEVAGEAKISVATLSRIENGKQSVGLGLFLLLAKVLHVSARELLPEEDEGNDKVDPLARRIAMLGTKQRTELWREVAAERRAQRGHNARADAAQQVEEMLAQIDFLRDELDTICKRIKKR